MLENSITQVRFGMPLIFKRKQALSLAEAEMPKLGLALSVGDGEIDTIPPAAALVTVTEKLLVALSAGLPLSVATVLMV